MTEETPTSKDTVAQVANTVEKPSAAQRLLIWCFWRLLRLSRIDCTLEEVARGTYPARAVPEYIEKIDAVSDVHLEIAKEKYEREEKRTQSVSDRVQSMQTLVGLVLSLLLATSVTGVLTNASMASLIVLVTSVFILLLTLIVLTNLQSVRTVSALAIDKELASEQAEKQKSRYLRAYFTATLSNSASNDYLVDVYRAANRMMLLGLVLASLAICLSVFGQRNSAEDIVRQLRADPTLIQLLRGPQGPAGVVGHQGIAGPVGPRGEDGKPGADCQQPKK